MFYGRPFGKHLRGISSMTDMTGTPNWKSSSRYREQLRSRADFKSSDRFWVSLGLPRNEE
jgi:hypothetical protein